MILLKHFFIIEYCGGHCGGRYIVHIVVADVLNELVWEYGVRI